MQTSGETSEENRFLIFTFVLVCPYKKQPFYYGHTSRNNLRKILDVFGTLCWTVGDRNNCIINAASEPSHLAARSRNERKMMKEHAETWEVRHGSRIALSMFGVFAAFIYYMLPSPLEPTLWQNPFPLPKLIGPLTPNNLLQHAEKAMCNQHGNCIAPESMAIASLADGRIVKLDKTGSFLANVFFSGGFVANNKSKNGLTAGTAKLMEWCKNEVLAHRLAWNTLGEKKCGRPLGIRISKNTLFFVDAYHGLFSLDLRSDGGVVSHLVNPSTTIYPPQGEETTSSSIDPVAFLPPKFFNDIDLTSDKIYFTDSSYKNTRSQNRAEVGLTNPNSNSKLTLASPCPN